MVLVWGSHDPQRGVEGAENLNPIIFRYFDPKSTQKCKKINFSTQVLREYISYNTTNFSVGSNRKSMITTSGHFETIINGLSIIEYP